jgi:hypothetical protein
VPTVEVTEALWSFEVELDSWRAMRLRAQSG